MPRQHPVPDARMARMSQRAVGMGVHGAGRTCRGDRLNATTSALEPAHRSAPSPDGHAGASPPLLPLVTTECSSACVCMCISKGGSARLARRRCWRGAAARAASQLLLADGAGGLLAQPRLDAARVEFVEAGQRAQLLAVAKLLGDAGAGATPPRVSSVSSGLGVALRIAGEARRARGGWGLRRCVL
jgi:hypothetical protein